MPLLYFYQFLQPIVALFAILCFGLYALYSIYSFIFVTVYNLIIYLNTYSDERTACFHYFSQPENAAVGSLFAIKVASAITV